MRKRIDISDDCKNVVECMKNGLNPNAGNMMVLLVKTFFPKTEGVDKALPIPERCRAVRIASDKLELDPWSDGASGKLEKWILSSSSKMEKRYVELDGEPLIPLRMYHESRFGISHMMLELIVASEVLDE